MTLVNDVYNFKNPAFNAFVFYTCVLAVKMLVMSFLTSIQRYSKKAFANPEDALLPKSKVRVDEDVERVRRAHLNDLENIPIFLLICPLYLLTGPSSFLAIWLMRAFTLARITHTIVYAVVVVPQPARGIAFGVGILITMYMAVTTILSFAYAM